MISRRTALGLLGAGAAAAGGAAYLGLGRRKLAEELDLDREVENPFRVLQRPFPAEPGRTVSILGYGGTRLPTLNRDDGQIDYALGERLIDFAYRHGINYFDTGWFYHKGESEKFLGKVLKKYPRESFMLSDKMAPWCVKTLDDAKALFEEQLRRLDTDYIDIYMIHSLSDMDGWRKMTDGLGVLDYLRGQRDKGRIRHFGFSFHGKSDFLERVLDADIRWAAAITLVNALEHRTNPDSRRVLKVLGERGVPAIAMEPLGGGRLMNLGAAAKARLAAADPGGTAAKWGFRYVLSHSEVLCSLSGMGHMKWLDENIRTHAEGVFSPLSDAEMELYGGIVDDFAGRRTIPCTGCRYCTPCPYGVAIPEVFAWYNSFATVGRVPAFDGGANDTHALRREFLMEFSRKVPRGCGPARCTGCRKCKVACPHFIFSVPDEMKRVAKLLADVEDAVRASRIGG